MTKAEHREKLQVAMLKLAEAYSLLKAVQTDLHNRTPVKKAPRQQGRVTPGVAAQVRNWSARYPHASYQALANRFNLNVGRVSEILVGRRT